MEVKNVEKKEKNSALITVSVSPEEFEAAVVKVFNKNRKNIQIPGFRKGKAPRKIVEAMYGEGVFHEEAINDLAPEAYYFAVKEKELKVVASPSIEDAKVEEDKSLTLDINCVLYPEVELGQYKGLSAVRKEAKVDPAEVDMEIDQLRNRNATIQTAERPAKFGDTVVLDYEGFIDGVPFEGGKDEKHSLEIGSNSFIPGFEIQLIGTSAGEDTEVNVTFPEDYHAEELKGKPAVFKCHIHEVKEKILPEADDEFAKDVSEFDTLADFRKNIEEKLLKQKESQTRDAFLDLLLTQVTGDMKVDLNEAMVNERAQQMVQDMAQRIANQGIPFETYLGWMGTNAEDFTKMQLQNAEKTIRQELALAKIAELEGLTVTEEDKDAELQKAADQYGVDLDTVKNFMDADMLTDGILYNKAADLIIANATALPEPAEEEKPAEEKAEDKAEEKAEEPEKAE
ncbi:MAG: trigger factor [Oscillospiraceae bacterium]|nr:trigger factor [Oscillospiraceae bacterium]